MSIFELKYFEWLIRTCRMLIIYLRLIAGKQLNCALCFVVDALSRFVYFYSDEQRLRKHKNPRCIILPRGRLNKLDSVPELDMFYNDK